MMILKGKNRGGEEAQRMKKEIELQKRLKLYHSERNYIVHYSINFYRKYPPETVERKWKEDISNLRRILDEYENK